MSNFTSKIKFLKKNRDKQIRKLSKLLKLLVETEWDMVTKSYEQNDNVALLASKSVADSSKNVQTAISQLIISDF
jgi:t-SNARE complex subunit (syntaxin)